MDSDPTNIESTVESEPAGTGPSMPERDGQVESDETAAWSERDIAAYRRVMARHLAYVATEETYQESGLPPRPWRASSKIWSGAAAVHSDAEGQYRVEVRSSLAPGSLTYGELVVPGATRAEVLFFTHICHPSLANDNTSGMAVATALAEWIAAEPRRFTYRFVFAPGTIGSLAWLKANQARLKRIRHGLVLALLGDPASLTYKRTRREDCEIDAIAAHVLARRGTLVPFSPYGYDERQLCSPGFDLPVGRLTRSVNDGYPQYHTSADNLELITAQALADSLQACQEMVEVIEGNERYLNRSPKGEPRLGKRGLYGALGGRQPLEREHALLWVLNQSDGRHSLLDIAERSGLKFAALRAAATELQRARLLGVPARAKGRARRRPPGTHGGRPKS